MIFDSNLEEFLDARERSLSCKETFSNIPLALESSDCEPDDTISLPEPPNVSPCWRDASEEKEEGEEEEEEEEEVEVVLEFARVTAASADDIFR